MVSLANAVKLEIKYTVEVLSLILINRHFFLVVWLEMKSKEYIKICDPQQGFKYNFLKLF